MKKPNLIRLSGWSFIIGAIAFLPAVILQFDYGSRTISPLMTNTFFWAPLLLVVGLLGLQARYKIGGGILLFGVIVGGLSLIIGGVMQYQSIYSVSVTYFGVWAGGVFVLHLCLFIFGIVMLIKRPLPRWNWIPLVAGMWIPLAVLLALILSGTAMDSPSSNIGNNFAIIILVIMTVAQVMLGYMLQSGVTEETKISQQGQSA